MIIKGRSGCNGGSCSKNHLQRKDIILAKTTLDSKISNHNLQEKGRVPLGGPFYWNYLQKLKCYDLWFYFNAYLLIVHSLKLLIDLGPWTILGPHQGSNFDVGLILWYEHFLAHLKSFKILNASIANSSVLYFNNHYQYQTK